MQEIIQIDTNKQCALFDITSLVKVVVQKSAIQSGIVSVYAQGATAAIMIQENWDESVQIDLNLRIFYVLEFSCHYFLLGIFFLNTFNA
jgi:thiamine phosphate synthase YjbQ (UPF0047 family)